MTDANQPNIPEADQQDFETARLLALADFHRERDINHADYLSGLDADRAQRVAALYVFFRARLARDDARQHGALLRQLAEEGDAQASRKRRRQAARAWRKIGFRSSWTMPNPGSIVREIMSDPMLLLTLAAIIQAAVPTVRMQARIPITIPGFPRL